MIANYLLYVRKLVFSGQVCNGQTSNESLPVTKILQCREWPRKVPLKALVRTVTVPRTFLRFRSPYGIWVSALNHICRDFHGVLDRICYITSQGTHQI